LSNWKAIVGLLAVVAALWLLYPSRQLSVPAGPDVVEIFFMMPGGPVRGAMEDLMREFERRSEEAHRTDPRRPIYRVVSGQNAARNQVEDPTRFLVAVAGGTPPDVIYFDRYAVAEWAARGAFEPLDDYIRRDLEAIRAGTRTDLSEADIPTPGRFFKTCWQEAMYKGRVYGIPNSVDNRALFYNAERLKAAGFKEVGPDGRERARPPKSWRELKEYAVKLTQCDTPRPSAPPTWTLDKELACWRAGWDLVKVDPPLSEAERAYAARLKAWHDTSEISEIGFPAYYGNSWLYMYGWMNGGAFMSPDRTKCTMDESRIAEALTFMRDVYWLQGGYTKVRRFEAGFQGEELDPFIQGKIAMKIDGVWVMQRHANFGRDLDFGVAPNPMPRQRIDALLAEQKRLRAEAEALEAAGQAAQAAAQREQARMKAPRISWCGGWAYAIPANARNKDAAWELIRFITSDRAFRIVVENERVIAESQGRLYVPNQCPVKKLNEEFYGKYVQNNERLPQRFKDGYAVFNDLIPYSKFRPVTPVGQVLWNRHRNAAEDVLEGEREPAESLAYHTAAVQRDLNRVLYPPEGREIRNWTWFFVAYGLLIVALGAGVFLWDTSQRFRSRVGRMLGLSRRKSESVIEGARGGYFRRQWFGGYLCASPWIVGFILLAGGPMLFSLVMSFCDFDVINPGKFIGLTNYVTMFTQEELFWKSLGNTAYMLIGVPLGMAVSLMMALLLNTKVRGMAVWRTFFYLPAIVPMVAASILWIWIFNPNGGFINRFLDLVGLQGPAWLQDKAWSKPAIILMGLWGAGGGMIIWLAGLKGINQQLYEAAEVDGANAWHKFWHITIPQLTPYIFFNLVMGTIGTFQIFGQAFIMTQGGPANSTLFYVYHLFNNAFRYGHMGYAAAMAWFLFVIVFLLTLLQMKLAKRWVYYESE
jgi:ABC-type sugar transport system permease subunit/ABC-type glycerol-3-phosphate transport system substrate-binding protein